MIRYGGAWIVAALAFILITQPVPALPTATPMAPFRPLKILFYQTALSPSHLPFSGRMADVLIDRGHTVVGSSTLRCPM
jgi:hypothetical protein